ncbi:hypothetical protein [Archangium minus]|uniref:hypothetical protein n=1 Tax=Archangium TaxID=47 RepID=UPI0037C0348D
MYPELGESLVWTWEDEDFLSRASEANFPDGNDPLAHRVSEALSLEPSAQLDGTA